MVAYSALFISHVSSVSLLHRASFSSPYEAACCVKSRGYRVIYDSIYENKEGNLRGTADEKREPPPRTRVFSFFFSQPRHVLVGLAVFTQPSRAERGRGLRRTSGAFFKGEFSRVRVGACRPNRQTISLGRTELAAPRSFRR